MGYDVPEDHIFAMRNKLDENGVYINEHNYDWGGEGKYAQTLGSGKSTIITGFIAPKYAGAGPLMVFGDSAGDENTGELRPSEKSIMPGETEEVLVRPAS